MSKNSRKAAMSETTRTNQFRRLTFFRQINPTNHSGERGREQSKQKDRQISNGKTERKSKKKKKTTTWQAKETNAKREAMTTIPEEESRVEENTMAEQKKNKRLNKKTEKKRLPNEKKQQLTTKCHKGRNCHQYTTPYKSREELLDEENDTDIKQIFTDKTSWFPKFPRNYKQYTENVFINLFVLKLIYWLQFITFELKPNPGYVQYL